MYLYEVESEEVQPLNLSKLACPFNLAAPVYEGLPSLHQYPPVEVVIAECTFVVLIFFYFGGSIVLPQPFLFVDFLKAEYAMFFCFSLWLPNSKVIKRACDEVSLPSFSRTGQILFSKF